MLTELDVVEGMQFDRGYMSPYFITNAEKMNVELDQPYILIHEKKLSGLQALLPLLEAVAQSGRPLLDHRRGCRGRSARDAGGEQAAWRIEGCRGQGTWLRRSSQGDARRYRGADRRPGDQRRARHQAGERHAGDARQGEEGADRQGEHHHRRRRRQEGRHRRSLQPDPRADRGDHLGLRHARSCRNGWRNWPAAWRSSVSAARPRSR